MERFRDWEHEPHEADVFGRAFQRQITRRPLKTAYSVFGIAMAAGVVVLGNDATDALDFIADFQFRQAQQQDLWVNFYEASPADAAYDLHHLPDVTRVETFRALSVRMHSEPRFRRQPREACSCRTRPPQ